MDIFKDFYLKIKLLREGAISPHQANSDDKNAGYEMYAAESVVIYPNEDVLVPVGWACEFPEDFAMIIKDKSGRRWRYKLQTGAGVIDSNYRDEVRVVLKNIGDTPTKIAKGEAIAQFIIIPVWNGRPEIVKKLNMLDDRGGGFGSTGLRNNIQGEI